MSTKSHQALLGALDRCQQLAEASKWNRLLHSPSKYLWAIYFRKIVYPKTKKGKLLQGSTFFGQPMQLLLPAAMDIFLLGCKTHDSELRLSRFLIQSLPSNGIFVDAGAHFGFYSLLAQKLMRDKGLILSIEASRSIYQVLAQNLENHTNIQAIHAALNQNDGGFIEFTEFPILYSEYNTLHEDQFENQDWYQKYPPQKIKVPARNLEGLLKEYTQQVADAPAIYIKIDVEGAELEVIRGLESYLEGDQQLTIIMEYWAGTAAPNSTQHIEAVQYLAKKGFQAFKIQDDGTLDKVQDWASIQQSENIVFKKTSLSQP